MHQLRDDGICDAIEADISQFVSFVSSKVSPAPFPPDWFDRNLTGSRAFVGFSFFISLNILCNFLNIFLLRTIVLLSVLLVAVSIVWFIRRFDCCKRLKQKRKSINLEPISDSHELIEEQDNLLASDVKARKPKDIIFENLGLELPNGQKVLEDVSFHFARGTITAIMGPSGSGKTTLLTTLAGRANYGKTTGKILVNGKETALIRLKKSIGFVPQEDTMYREMTVRETLEFSGYSRLDSNLKRHTKKAVIDEALKLLGLDGIQDSLIGDENIRGISGGQRKRVNLGIELVSRPTILLLDEPTSGLDSAASLEMLRALRQLAAADLTIAAVVHQPSWKLMQLFDNIIILSKGGVTAYSGSVLGLQPYFESLGFTFEAGENKIDICLDAVSGTIRSSKGNVTPESLPQIWKSKQDELLSGYQNTAVVQVLNDNNNNNNSAKDLVGGGALIPQEQLLPEEGGTLSGFITWLLICLFLPFLSLLPYYVKSLRTKHNQTGSYLGLTFSIFILITILMVWASNVSADLNHLTQAKMFFACFTWGFIGPYYTLTVLSWLVLLIFRLRRVEICTSVGAHVAMSMLFGPLMLPLIVFFFAEKLRYASVLGLGVWVLVLGVMSFVWQLLQFATVLSQQFLSAQLYLILFVTTGLVLMAVAAYRWRRIPSADRVISGFLSQFYLQFKRAGIQMSRDLFGICFDLLLPFSSGLCVGLVTLGKQWTPPFTEISQWGSNATICLGCYQGVARTPSNIVNMCRLLNLNNDPFPAIGLMVKS